MSAPLRFAHLSLSLVLLSAHPLCAQITVNQIVVNQIDTPPVDRKTEKDTAIVRARFFLEIPSVRLGITQALHMTATDLHTSFIEAHEEGAGANLTYTYKWTTLTASGTNKVTFHCDPMGRIDHIVKVLPGNDHAFYAFGKALDEGKNVAVEQIVDVLMSPGDDQQAEKPDKSREIVTEILKFGAEQAIVIDPQWTLEKSLGYYFDSRSDFSGFPAYGLDGFHFGLGKSVTERQTTMEQAQLRAALTQLISDSAAAAGLQRNVQAPYPYDREANAIADVAGTCAQITAHEAFVVTSYGGRGDENIASLGPAYHLCSATPTLHPALPGNAGPPPPSRPIVFSVAPIGRGWRDAGGMTVGIGFAQRPSDPNFTAAELFYRYGITIIRVPQTDVPCPNPPGTATLPDRQWRLDGATAIFRVRFDCDHAEVYDLPTHLILADLTLVRAPSDPHKDRYQGIGLLSTCPNGTGKVQMDRWSATRIELKVEEPNTQDHLCGGIKAAHPIDAMLHTDTNKVTLVPYTH